MRGKKIVGKTNKRKQWQRKKKQAYFEVKIERGSNHRRKYEREELI